MARRTWVLALIVATLAGCGRVPLLGPGAAAPRGAAFQRGLQLEGSHAQQFYARMKGAYQGQVALEGDRVSLTSPDQPVSVYDFSETARTGKVHLTIGEFTLDLAFAELMVSAPDGETGTEVLPALLVPIAMDMAAAGGQALVIYWLRHRGDAFDKGDAAKAVGLAMALAIVPFLGEMSALGHVIPLAAKLVAACPSFEAREVMRAAAGLTGEFIDLVKVLIKLRKQKQQGGERVVGVIV